MLELPTPVSTMTIFTYPVAKGIGRVGHGERGSPGAHGRQHKTREADGPDSAERNGIVADRLDGGPARHRIAVPRADGGVTTGGKAQVHPCPSHCSETSDNHLGRRLSH